MDFMHFQLLLDGCGKWQVLGKMRDKFLPKVTQKLPGSYQLCTSYKSSTLSNQKSDSYSRKMFLARILPFSILLLIPINKASAGYCSAQSSSCGQQCNTETDCLGGDCKKVKDNCPKATDYCDAESGECPEYRTSEGYCNHESGSECGEPCTDDTPGKCWVDQDDCTPIGKCNYKSESKCGNECCSADDCSPGQCWVEITDHECDEILLYYCDTDSGDKCGQQCLQDDSECSSGHCVEYKSACGGNGYCDAQSDNCGDECSEDSKCSGGYCLEIAQSCKSTITIGTYIGAEPG